VRRRAAVTSLEALTIFSSLVSSVEDVRVFRRGTGRDSVDEEGSARVDRRRARSALWANSRLCFAVN
jgi:hypothetical protein